MDETIITIIILVISFLSWLFSQIKENQDKQANKQVKGKNPPKRPVELSEEIEAFLQEISGNQPQPARQKKKKPPVTKSRPPQRKQPPKKPKPEYKPIPADQSRSFETNISKRHLESKNLGSDLTQHVSSYLDQDVKTHVETHISRQIGASVSSHLGQFSKNISGSGRQSSETHPIVDMFKDQESVAKAIVLNEILSPPLSQRKKTS